VVRLGNSGSVEGSLAEDPVMRLIEQQAKQWDVFGAETGGLFPCFTVSEQSKN
jgi:hypothetical protein